MARLRLAIASALVLGGTVSTGAGQVALRLASGGSLRFGPRARSCSRARTPSSSLRRALFRLRGSTRRSDFNVTTEFGAVRDVGTQFLARSTAKAGSTSAFGTGASCSTNDGAFRTGRRRRAARRYAGFERHSSRNYGQIRRRLGLGGKARAAVRHRRPHRQRLFRVVLASRRAAGRVR